MLMVGVLAAMGTAPQGAVPAERKERKRPHVPMTDYSGSGKPDVKQPEKGRSILLFNDQPHGKGAPPKSMREGMTGKQWRKSQKAELSGRDYNPWKPAKKDIGRKNKAKTSMRDRRAASILLAAALARGKDSLTFNMAQAFARKRYCDVWGFFEEWCQLTGHERGEKVRRASMWLRSRRAKELRA